MSMRIELDFAHGLAEPAVEQGQDGAFRLSLTRGIERVEIRLSLPSLVALRHALNLALGQIERC